jgi:hypothetical protein
MSEIEKMSAEDFARTVDAVYYDYHGLRARTDENMAGVDVEHMRVQAELVRRLAELDALRAERRECPECSIECADCGCTWRDHYAIDAVLECGNCGHRPCGGSFSSPKTEAALGAQEGSGDGE